MFRFPSSTYFNPRPRMGSDSFTITMPLDVVGISIHAPAWGATAAYGSVFPSVTNISIHAPAWGATPANSGIPGIFTFQSTPPHGERPYSRDGSALNDLFQSTPPHGERPIEPAASRAALSISIHAPAWGATRIVVVVPYFHIIFQSTPPHGERPLRWGDRAHDHHFNPRPRMGSDRQLPRFPFLSHYFNPRPRMGSDSAARACRMCLSISIHAPAWGATILCFLISRKIRISIHAPAWGATPIISVRLYVLSHFNPRPRMGSDMFP